MGLAIGSGTLRLREQNGCFPLEYTVYETRPKIQQQQTEWPSEAGTLAAEAQENNKKMLFLFGAIRLIIRHASEPPPLLDLPTSESRVL